MFEDSVVSRLEVQRDEMSGDEYATLLALALGVAS